MCQHNRMSGATLDRDSAAHPTIKGRPITSTNSPCLLNGGLGRNRCCSTTDHFAVGQPRNDKGRRSPDQQGCRRRAEGEGPLAHSGGHLFSATSLRFMLCIFFYYVAAVNSTAHPPKEWMAWWQVQARQAGAEQMTRTNGVGGGKTIKKGSVDRRQPPFRLSASFIS